MIAVRLGLKNRSSRQVNRTTWPMIHKFEREQKLRPEAECNGQKFLIHVFRIPVSLLKVPCSIEVVSISG